MNDRMGMVAKLNLYVLFAGNSWNDPPDELMRLEQKILSVWYGIVENMECCIRTARHDRRSLQTWENTNVCA